MASNPILALPKDKWTILWRMHDVPNISLWGKEKICGKATENFEGGHYRADNEPASFLYCLIIADPGKAGTG